MGISITTLQGLSDKQQLQIKIMKYVIIGLSGVALGELVYIGVDKWVQKIE